MPLEFKTDPSSDIQFPDELISKCTSLAKKNAFFIIIFITLSLAGAVCP